MICAHLESCFGDLIEQSGYLVYMESRWEVSAPEGGWWWQCGQYYCLFRSTWKNSLEISGIKMIGICTWGRVVMAVWAREGKKKYYCLFRWSWKNCFDLYGIKMGAIYTCRRVVMAVWAREREESWRIGGNAWDLTSLDQDQDQDWIKIGIGIGIGSGSRLDLDQDRGARIRSER